MHSLVQTQRAAIFAISIGIAAAFPSSGSALAQGGGAVLSHELPRSQNALSESPGTEAGSLQALADTITFRQTNLNNIGLRVWNTGFMGTNFENQSPAPSFEYPLGSKIDHLVRGGLWVGGVVETGGALDTLVTTGATDGVYGGDPRTATEFFPTVPGIEERSILRLGHYDPRAISHQDFLCSFDDRRIRAGTDHQPLGIQVSLETLLFSFPPFDAIVIANFKIKSRSPAPIKGLCVGFYSELATGLKVPPPGSTNPFSGWFRRKDIAYAGDSLRLVSEHRYMDSQAYSWCGIKLLGTRPDTVQNLPIAFRWWKWSVDQPRNDAERYLRMASGRVDATEGFEADNDPVELIAVGPLPRLFTSDDSLTFSVAFVGGQPDPRSGRTPEEDLLYHAAWAQKAFDLNFKIPLPPPSPVLAVFPRHSGITLRWKSDPESFLDPKSHEMDFEGYRLYIGESRQETDARRILEADRVDSVFYNTGLDAIREPAVVDTDHYAYRFDIDGLKDGFKYWTSVTSFDTGTPDVPSLESGLAENRTYIIPGSVDRPSGVGGKVRVFPNPYRGDAAWDGSQPRDRYLWFSNLPARCTIRIYTLAGDLVDTIQFDKRTYHATDIRGLFDPTDRRNPDVDIPTLSGGMAAWDLISRKDQGVANGLYIFSVEDLDTGEKELGKFLILR